MKILRKLKDGGPASPVDAYFLCEFKGFFSVAILRFNKGGREAFHTHAFNALTWFLAGDLQEEKFDGTFHGYRRSLLPKFTARDNNHRVRASETSWCFTIRGPWVSEWTEHQHGAKTIFGWGRKVKSQTTYS